MSHTQPPLRAAVIGLGVGQAHMEAYAALEGVELVAIAGVEDERREELAAKFNVPRHYHDWQDLVADGGIDVVSVAVPTFLHAPMTIAALEAGLHVLSEKPMARDLDEALTMAAAARAAGRVLEVAFNHRRRGDIQALRAVVESGELGKIYHARCEWMRRAGIPALGSWFVNKEMSGGGPLIDLGIHILDYTLALMGEPKVLSASAVTHAALGPRGLGGAGGSAMQVNSAYEVEDLATVLLRLEGGRSLQLETSWASYRPEGDEFGVTLFGEDGGARIAVNNYTDAALVEIWRDQDGVQADRVIQPEPVAGHHAVVAEFVAHVQAGPDTWAAHTGAEGLSRTAVLDACYRSAAEGREVAVRYETI